MKLPHKAISQNFATTIGLLITLSVFGLGIGLALFVQNQEQGRQQVWPLNQLINYSAVKTVMVS